MSHKSRREGGMDGGTEKECADLDGLIYFNISKMNKKASGFPNCFAFKLKKSTQLIHPWIGKGIQQNILWKVCLPGPRHESIWNDPPRL